MKAAVASFEANAAAALADLRLQRALGDVPGGFAAARARVTAALPEFEALRRIGRDIKDHALSHLDLYLEAFERNAAAAGAIVHWAPTATDASDIILDICRAADARLVTKSKSMVSEEIGLGARLQAAALRVVETDLGEYAIQIRGETPSHIIAPAIHLGQTDIEADFRRHHGHLAAGRNLASPEALVAEARAVLRESFLAADVGITGANLLVAATGSAIIVTNEGNADLTLSLPRVHIVLASIEKVVPTLADAFVLLRLLARSATGQEITAYTTFVTGSRRPEDLDGPARVPRRTRRQRPLGAARHGLARGAALHPLRRLHEPLPGLLRRRRACLRRDLSRTHRRGADAGARRVGVGARGGGGLDVLRPLRVRVPGGDSAGQPHAPLARSLLRAVAGLAAARDAEGMGLARAAPARLSPRRPHDRVHARRTRAPARGIRAVAVRRTLDAGSRFPGAAGRHLPGAVEPQTARRISMSREAMLARIRTALEATPGDAGRRSTVDARLADARPHLVPERARGPHPELIELFKAHLAAQSADFIEVAEAALIPAAVASYLEARALPLRIRCGCDGYLAQPAWEETGVAFETGAARATDTAGLSRAAAGAAETGTLVLASGPENPVTLAFVPDTHIVVVRASTIVGTYEQACALVTGERLPRTLNLISGPSRTGDIGGRIVMGAHGPRRLAVILVADD